ncbi:MAG: rhodanese-like domain-containing protein [Saprospiraceae bacterium]|nr:rhodanese-like domain-containing protein [Saprospiraceae bacterium]
MTRIIIVVLLLGVLNVSAQQRKGVSNKKYALMLNSLLKRNVPEIYVAQLYESLDSCTILDTRERAEFNISHIPNAIYVGYDSFNIDSIKSIPKNKKIVCYCSVGYRSEKVTKQLIKAGYTSVSNLYGSIFEWVNREYPVVNNRNETIMLVHGYSKYWSKYIKNQRMVIVY